MRQHGSGLTLFGTSFALMLLLATGPALQAQGAKAETQTKTKVTIKDGKDITAVGCVERDETGTLVLRKAADKHGPLSDYVLVTDEKMDQELSEHVGHQLEISGKAANRGDGKVKFEVEEKTKDKGGKEAKTQTKSEVEGSNLKYPFLGVKSFKMLAAACR